jgi:hypothetical protein
MERRRTSTTISPIRNNKHTRLIPAIAPEDSWWEVAVAVVGVAADGSLGEPPTPVYVLELWRLTPFGLPVEDGNVGVPWTFWGTPPLGPTCPLLFKGVPPGGAEEDPVAADGKGELARAMGDDPGASAGAGVVVTVLPLPVVLPLPPPPFPLPFPLLPLPLPLPVPLPLPPPVPLPPPPPPPVPLPLPPPVPPPLPPPVPLPPPLLPPPLLPPPLVPPPLVLVGVGIGIGVGVGAGEVPPLFPPTIEFNKGESIGTDGTGIGKLIKEGSRSSSPLFITARCRREMCCILYQS